LEFDDEDEPESVGMEIRPVAPLADDGTERLVALVTYDGTVLTDVTQVEFSDISDAPSRTVIWWGTTEGTPDEPGPEPTSGYYWGLDHWTDLNGLHSIYMVEKAFPAAPPESTVLLYWTLVGKDPVQSNTAIPHTPGYPGYTWELASETDLLNVHSFYFIEVALPSASTVVVMWGTTPGVAGEDGPAPTTGYYWALESWTDLNGVHTFQYVEKSLTDGLTVQKSWNGVVQDCIPPTPKGQVWEVVDLTLVAGVLTLVSESRCLSMWDEPGRCPVSGDFSIPIDPDNNLDVTFTDGFCDAPAGTVLQMGTQDGQTISVTVGAGGELTDYVGIVAIGDPATGTTSYYRISSSGRLEQ